MPAMLYCIPLLSYNSVNFHACHDLVINICVVFAFSYFLIKIECKLCLTTLVCFSLGCFCMGSLGEGQKSFCKHCVKLLKTNILIN